jgi:small-conductance mechanosensitive channel
MQGRSSAEAHGPGNIFRLREFLPRYNTYTKEGFMNGIIYLVGLVVVVLAVLSLFGLR